MKYGSAYYQFRGELEDRANCKEGCIKFKCSIRIVGLNTDKTNDTIILHIYKCGQKLDLLYTFRAGM